MTVRMSTKTVTFTKPFTLRGLKRTLPAGDYTVETHEELIEGVSFPVYRRILTQIRLCRVPGHPGRVQTLEIDPQHLNDALAHEDVHRTVAEGRKYSHG